MLVLGIVVGVPAALVLLVGNPIPEMPRDALGSQVPIEFVLDVIVCIVWLAWAQLVSCLVAELVAGVRGRGLPWRVPFAAGGPAGLRPPAGDRDAAAGHRRAGAAERAGAARPPARAGGGDRDRGGGPGRGHRGEPGRTAAAQRADERPATAQPERAPAAAAKATKQYVVMPPQGRHHDSLWDIAERYLGSGIRYRELFELNQGRTQPDGSQLTLESLIRPGWTLIMPADARGEGLIEVTPDRPAPAPRAADRHPGRAGRRRVAVRVRRRGRGRGRRLGQRRRRGRRCRLGQRRRPQRARRPGRRPAGRR